MSDMKRLGNIGRRVFDQYRLIRAVGRISENRSFFENLGKNLLRERTAVHKYIHISARCLNPVDPFRLEAGIRRELGSNNRRRLAQRLRQNKARKCVIAKLTLRRHFNGR